MNRTNFHINNYGWNFFFIKVKKGIRIGRYFTNGSDNRNEMFLTNSLPIEPPTCWEECDEISSKNPA